MINDLIIFGSHGIPYVARCYGGSACKADQDHTLISGFFAALTSFTSEFADDELRTVEFKTSLMEFSRRGDVLIAISTDFSEGKDQIREDIERILSKFVEFNPELSAGFDMSDSHRFKDFDQWLDTNFNPDWKGDLRPVLKKKTTSLWGRIKSIFA